MDYRKNHEFEEEFTSDEEAEAFYDEFIKDLFSGIAEEKETVSVVNPNKIKIIAYTYKLMKHLCKGIKADVSYTLHEPYASMGVVSVIAKNLTFKHTEKLLAAAKLASNFNVYPKTDGTVRMDFTFHGITTTIE